MFEALEKKMNVKLEEFGNRINDLESSLKEKDSIISKLKQKISKFENEFENCKENVNTIKNHIDDVIEKRNSEQHNEEKFFTCKQCEFSTASSRGLKTHMKRKHTKEVETFPFDCELCGDKVDNKIELKNHMVTHSFRSVKFQCEECDYCGENEMTMAVHVGKHHSENILCGLCDCVMDDQESLETHLFTCEIYQCYYEEYKFKTLANLKEHVKTEHAEENGQYEFIHAKQGRTSSDQIVCKTYTMSELFPELLHN